MTLHNKTGDSMNKKVFTLSAVMAGLLFGAAAHAADTRIGVTIYKYDDNFMSVVRKAIEKDGKSAPDVQLLMNDSQNDQSKQNDQIDVLLAKGVKALAINLVDPAAAGTVIEKARGQNIPVVFFNKEPSRKALDSYDKAYYVGTDSKESGIIQGDLIAKHWKANPNWDLNKDGAAKPGSLPAAGHGGADEQPANPAERRAGPSGCGSAYHLRY